MLGLTGFRSFDNDTRDRVLRLLEAAYLRLGKRITLIQFGVNDGGANGRGFWNRGRPIRRVFQLNATHATQGACVKFNATDASHATRR